MNNVINDLKAERDALRLRLEKIEDAIAQYEEWARSVAELVGADKVPLATVPRDDPSAEQTPMAAFEEEVRALFSRVSAPLKRADVYDALTTAGVVVAGKDPLNTVASRLSRMEGIMNLRGHGYWAADRPYPPAGHTMGSASTGGLFEEAATEAEVSSPADGAENSTEKQ